MTPYKDLFGVDDFDLDSETDRSMTLDKEPQSNEELAKRYKRLHCELLKKGAD